MYDIVHQRIHNLSNAKDICGGALYRDLYSTLLHSIQNYVTLTFNTDGIPIVKSSNYAFWSVFLMINELPFKMRYPFN